MQTIPIALAQPEMVLAKDVVRPDNPAGPPICGKGILLTESLLARLRNMGIQMLTVEGHPVWVEGEKTLDELLIELDRRFRRSEGDELMMKLKELFRTQILHSRGVDDGR